MNLKTIRIFTVFVAVLITACKEKPVRIISYMPEIVLEQVIMSSKVYCSPDFNLKLPNNLTLVYRYSNHICQTCIVEDLMELRDFQQKIGKEKILVLPAFPEDRNSKIKLNNELSGFNYQNISIDSLILPRHETEGEKRYFAVLDNEGKMEMVFFPKNGFPNITRAYFKEVEKRMQLHSIK